MNMSAWRNVCAKRQLQIIVSGQPFICTKNFGTSIKRKANPTDVLHNYATEQPNILIVGAGLAGLALAQILKSNGISFQIFERDQAPNSRLQGWAVALTQCVNQFER